MKKLNLFFATLMMFFVATSCDRNELLEQEQRPVVPSLQPSIEITGEGLIATRSSTVEFTGGYCTGAGLYPGDADVSVKAVPYSGYKLVDFTGGSVSGNSSQFSGSDSYSFNIESQDWKFTVSFKQEFTITLIAEEGGTVSGGGKVGDGESCTVIATPDADKLFDGWYENEAKVSSDASYIFTVSSNRTDKHLKAVHNHVLFQ